MSSIGVIFDAFSDFFPEELDAVRLYTQWSRDTG